MNPNQNPVAAALSQAVAAGNGYLTNDVYPFVYGTQDNAGQVQQASLMPLIVIVVILWFLFR